MLLTKSAEYGISIVLHLAKIGESGYVKLALLLTSITSVRRGAIPEPPFPCPTLAGRTFCSAGRV